jgi:protein phosphatase methylesterase 1
MQSGISGPSGLPPKFPGSSGISNGARGGGGGRKRDYTPVHWDQYFERREEIKIGDNDTFVNYESGDAGPVLVLLHGGGFSGLTWALFAQDISQKVKCRQVLFNLPKNR